MISVAQGMEYRKGEMDTGRNNLDTVVQAKWVGLEYAGDEPTLEEFILWMAEQKGVGHDKWRQDYRYRVNGKYSSDCSLPYTSAEKFSKNINIASIKAIIERSFVQINKSVYLQ